MSMEMSSRSAYLGANVKPVVKRALRDEAAKRGEEMSVSLLVSDIIEEKLTSLGYDLNDQIVGEDEPPLPFDAMRELQPVGEP